MAGFYVALAEGGLLSAGDARRDDRRRRPGIDRVLGEQAGWGLGVGLDDDGWGMGGVGGSFGWWSDAGEYAFGFVTGHIADHDRGDRVENARPRRAWACRRSEPATGRRPATRSGHGMHLGPDEARRSGCVVRRSAGPADGARRVTR